MYFYRHANFLKFIQSWLRVYILIAKPKNQPAREGFMFRWIIKDELAAGPRPRLRKKPCSQVPRSLVDTWIKKVKTRFGIRSIICLLDNRQLRLYAELDVDLVSYYRASGFHVTHIPVRNYQHPALCDCQLHEVWKAYKQLEKPVLIHCSAGIGRTGKAASYIKRKVKDQPR